MWDRPSSLVREGLALTPVEPRAMSARCPCKGSSSSSSSRDCETLLIVLRSCLGSTLGPSPPAATVEMTEPEPLLSVRLCFFWRGTWLLRQECRRRNARNWRDNVHLPQMSGGGTASATESTGGEGAQKGGRVGVASRTCAKARARAVTRSSSCTIANVCTLHHRRPASAPQ